MLVGVPKEIKNHEYRVGLTPAAVKEFVSHGHSVLVETNAGDAIGFTNEMYVEAGAAIASTAEQVFAEAEMIIKVKEPQPNECKMLRKGQTLYTYLHLAPDPTQTKLLVESGATCIAYETVTDDRGGLPLLAPMSEVAGRMAVQNGAKCLEGSMGGKGKLLSGVPGVEPATVTILGGGIVGTNAAKVAGGLGAKVYILDINLSRLKYLDDIMPSNVITLYSNKHTIMELLPKTDLLIGSVLLVGAKAPNLVTRDMLSLMQKGSVIVDVAVDQGGCVETCKPTTHADPTYEVDGVIHYCVANMPGSVPYTSTFALANATFPYIKKLVNYGCVPALRKDKSLCKGLNIYKGTITHSAVAEAFDMNYVLPQDVIE